MVKQCGREEWEKFRRYHYLDTSLSKSAQCYGLYDNENIIGFIAVLHQPHSRNTKIKRCSRLVILPDYQGIGLGYKFLNIIADRYKQFGYDFSIVTSAKNFIYKLYGSDKWRLKRCSINRDSKKENSIDHNRNSMRNNCKTASFFYV